MWPQLSKQIQPQSLRPRLTVWIQKRRLPDSNGPVAKALSLVVECRRVEHRSVVPDGDVILVSPLEPHLQVVVVQNHPVEFVQQLLALLRVQLVDPLGKRTQCKDALPASHWIRTYHRVHCRQVFADILRAATGFLVDDHIGILLRGANKPIPNKCSRQSLKELLVRPREPVVNLVAARPQRVTTPTLRQLRKPERGVVCRTLLELDVAVPACGVVAALVGLVGVGKHLLARHGRNMRDLIVAHAKFRGAVEHRVDVQRGGGRLAGKDSQGLDKLFLQLVGEVVLGAEDDHASLGDWKTCVLAT